MFKKSYILIVLSVLVMLSVSFCLCLEVADPSAEDCIPYLPHFPFQGCSEANWEFTFTSHPTSPRTGPVISLEIDAVC